MATERVEYIVSLKDLFTPKIRTATNETNKLNDAVKKTTKSAFDLGSSIKSALVGIGAGMFAKSIVDTTAAMQGFENAIMAGSSSVQEGQKNIAFLNSEVDRLGIPLDAAFKGFKTFQGAVQGTSLDGEKARKIFTSVSQAATVMGLSADDTEGVFLAMGQMVSKGTVQAEELRGQLGERLPGAFRRAAEAMGMTTQELGKAMQKGEVMAEDLLPKLADQLGIAFDKEKLKNATGGLMANMNRMNTEFARLKTSLGNELMPVLIGFFKLIQSGLLFLQKHRGIIYGLVAGFVAFKIATISLTASWNALTTAMMENPIGLIAVGVGLLVVAIWELQKRFEGFRGFLYGLWASIVEIFAGIKNVIWGALTWDNAMFDKGIEQFKNLGNAYSQAFKKGVASGGTLSDAMGGGSIGATNTGITDATTKSKTDGVGTNVDRISAVKPTNVYVNITKLVEQLNVQMQTIKDSPNKIREEVAKALISAVNDVNLITA